MMSTFEMSDDMQDAVRSRLDELIAREGATHVYDPFCHLDLGHSSHRQIDHTLFQCDLED